MSKTWKKKLIQTYKWKCWGSKFLLEVFSTLILSCRKQMLISHIHKSVKKNQFNRGQLR